MQDEISYIKESLSPKNLRFTFVGHLNQRFKVEMVASQMHVGLIEEAVKTNLETLKTLKTLKTLNIKEA